jgi:diguanylate cyclase (GGDEF)-like protein/PAS domain S-box-containing protein
MSKIAPLRYSIKSSLGVTKLNALLLILTITLFSYYLYLSIPSLLKDLRLFIDAPEYNTQLFLTTSSRLALSSKKLPELNEHIRAVSQLPHIRGVIIANRNNRIVAGAWHGEEMSDIEATQKLMDENWQRWAVKGPTGAIGSISVVFDEGWSEQLQRTIVYFSLIAVGGFVFLVILIAWSFHNRLAHEVMKLNQAAVRIASGDFSVRLSHKGNNPVVKLIQGFNRMAQELDVFTKKLRISEERFDLAVNGSNDGIWDWDIQNNRLYLSPRFKELLGYREDELPGMFNAWKRLIHPEDEPRVMEAIDRHLKHSDDFRCELRLKSKKGEWLWMLGRGKAVWGKFNMAMRMAGSFTDIAEQKATQQALVLEKERAQVTLHSIVDGVITTDKDGRVDYMNPKAELLTGRFLASAEGRPLLTVFNITDAERKPVDQHVLTKVLQQRMTVKFTEQTLLQSANSTWFSIEVNAAPLGGQPQVTGMVVVFHDITERQKLWQALRKEREQALVTLQSIGDGVITTDIEGKVVYMNSSAEQLTGWSCSDSLKAPVTLICKLVDRFGVATAIDSVKHSSTPDQNTTDLGQAELLSRTGEKYIVEHNISPLRDKERRVIGCVLVLHNVTERHKLMQQLSYQASHDSLTQLINRQAFELRLEKTLESPLESGPEPVGHVVCYMDLDQFKIVNDTSGHSAGDELLRQVSIRIKEQVRKGDTLARLGGDEFGLLLESCDLDNAVTIAENIRQSVESFRFAWEDKSFSISISIGIAPVSGGSGAIAELLSSVDQACYIAKNQGRNQIHIYQPGDSESSRWNREMQWVPHINRSLDENRFLLYAQPIVPINTEDKTEEHYEILLRMKDDSGRIIAPGAFLPAAERYGIMPKLDRWVVENAISALSAAWQKGRRFTSSTFALNISGAVLSDNGFLRYVKQVLDSYGFPPQLLCFEITETVAIANFSHAIRFVNELKDIGCSFALDDFGSGFASFSNLKTLPVDYLKIDGSFIRPLLESPVDYTMVEVINQIGHVMGLKTIAEFVETEEVLESLRNLGVDYAQGYYLGKPLPLSQVWYEYTDIKECTMKQASLPAR